MSDSSDPRRWRALLVLSAAQLVLMLDMSVVNVALAPVQHDLHFSPTGLAWIIDAYALPFGGLLLLAGRVADLIGRKRTFLGGLACFALSSALGGLAQTPALLIVARCVQGASAAFVAPSALALLSLLFPHPRERATAFSVWGGLRGAGVTLGVVLSGALVGLLSWRWLFFLNVPVAAALLLLAWRLLDESRIPGESRRLDVAGAVLVTSGFTLIAFGLLRTAGSSWAAPMTILALALGLLLTLLFIVVEAHDEHPLVPLPFFSSPRRSIGNLSLALFSAGLAVLFFSLPLYLQNVLGYSVLRTGLAFLPVGPTFIVMAYLSPFVIRRLGERITMGAGLSIVTVSFLLLSRLSVDASYLATVLPSLILFPLGGAMVVTAGTIAGISGTDAKNAGLAGGVNNVAQQMGMALGLAALVSLGSARSRALLARGITHSQALTSGFALSFSVTAIAVLVMAIYVFGRSATGAEHGRS
ncbi:MFS transporter [bacterium]|nr:MAG: MFS transporter [bacterium]